MNSTPEISLEKTIVQYYIPLYMEQREIDVKKAKDEFLRLVSWLIDNYENGKSK